MPRPLQLARTVEDSIVLALFDIANELGKLGDGVASRAGLTTQQWLLLLQIAGDPNFATAVGAPVNGRSGITASQIAAARGVSRANVSVLVAQLLRMGLVGQVEQPDDRRHKQLVVTAAGRKALADVDAARHLANRNLLANLSLAERNRLLRSLLACLDRLWLVDRSGGVAAAPAPRPRRRNA